MEIRNCIKSLYDISFQSVGVFSSAHLLELRAMMVNLCRLACFTQAHTQRDKQTKEKQFSIYSFIFRNSDKLRQLQIDRGFCSWRRFRKCPSAASENYTKTHSILVLPLQLPEITWEQGMLLRIVVRCFGEFGMSPKYYGLLPLMHVSWVHQHWLRAINLWRRIYY